MGSGMGRRRKAPKARELRQGKLTYSAGPSFYDGGWHVGHLAALISLGERVQAGQKHGYGKQLWPSGNCYEGEWKSALGQASDAWREVGEDARLGDDDLEERRERGDLLGRMGGEQSTRWASPRSLSSRVLRREVLHVAGLVPPGYDHGELAESPVASPIGGRSSNGQRT